MSDEERLGRIEEQLERIELIMLDALSRMHRAGMSYVNPRDILREAVDAELQTIDHAGHVGEKNDCPLCRAKHARIVARLDGLSD